MSCVEGLADGVRVIAGRSVVPRGSAVGIYFTSVSPFIM